MYKIFFAAIAQEMTVVRPCAHGQILGPHAQNL